jgi:predicted dehydrogenase
VADHYDVPVTTTDWRQLVDSEDVDALVVATPHSTHAEIAVAALGAGKHVFVEKPLAISLEELEQVARAADQSAGVLLVGHNRRFAPLVQRLRDTLTVPLLIQIRVAAGALDDGHWLTDPYEGGRILGEISHFVDLATYLARSYPVGVAASTVPTGGGAESLAGLLQFENGGAATLVYSVGPAGNLGKEMIEVFSPSGAAALDDYTRLDLHGYADDRVKSRRDKGHRAQLEAFVRAAQGSVEPPVQLREQLVVAAASLALVEAARTRERIDVRQPI